MSWPLALRVVAGILVGLGLGCVPFLQYGHHGHHHATASVAHTHHH